MLHVCKDRTDVLSLVDVANGFAGEKENRKELLGKFTENDVPDKATPFLVNTDRKFKKGSKG